MHNSKKHSMLTLVSAGVLLGILNTANCKPVHADTLNSPTTNTNNVQNQNTTDQTQNFSSNDSASVTNADQTSDSTQTSTQASDLQLTDEAKKALADVDIDEYSLNQDQIEKINQINFNDINIDTGTQWTYDQFRGTANKMIDQDKQYRVPYFNAKKIKNMPATYTKDAQTGKKTKLDVWDSWPIQDEKTGHVVNYKGYQLAIAMMGQPKHNDSHIYLLYNKYGDNKLSHWKTAGPIFGFKGTPLDQEWSGSATVNSDGTIQLFYTDVDTRKGDNHQKISTANLVLKIDKKGRLKIAKVRNRHELFEGDGYHYQTYKQWKSTNKGADNIAMRDAHVINVDGDRYLVFEASTGTENYQGEDQIYNWQNYGGSDQENLDDFLKINSDDDMKSRASWANAAIGILRLDDNENNPSVEEVMIPLITSPMVSDEIERPNIVPMNGRYYLFATTRLNHGTNDALWRKANRVVGDNVTMLGWVSDHLTYGYEPLNGDATVLTASVPFNWRTGTYSYYAVPFAGSDDQVLITSYMTNRGYAAGKGKRATWAPSFLLRINPDDTTEVEDVVTNQGDWIYDESSRNDKMLATSLAGARLKGEPDPDVTGELHKIPLKKKHHKKTSKKKAHHSKKHVAKKQHRR
ncbi:MULTISPECIES: glycoside hydrolase family 68 protein [Lactobacillus]|uniref:Levansucrase n=1 Tax=Lactobacillus xujianguonis TaxID=2495899 RepID=A0A437SU42_9LACO|nr:MULTISPECIES: glycoside hydrolase family 68 protein [Lactobacillus]RVU70410.1 levansucrase [Lactobacillus xujianguonis]RVU73657.1 levansucrase [Lactobacillus xujianguonis]